jgi:hypothetical protein
MFLSKDMFAPALRVSPIRPLPLYPKHPEPVNRKPPVPVQIGILIGMNRRAD